MIVTICSLFRDSSRYLHRYFTQLCSQLPITQLRFVFLEGDSRDDTLTKLREWASGPYAANVQVLKHDLGVPRFGPVAPPVPGGRERFIALAEIGNIVLDAVPANSDYTCWLESDLIIPPGLLPALLQVAKGEHVAAPYVYHARSKVFYDTWAFRDKGCVFTHLAPYARKKHTTPFELSSAGSVLLIPHKYIAAGARFTEEEVIVGLCKNIRKEGGKIMAVPNIQVYHP